MDNLTKTLKDHPPQYGRDFIAGLIAALRLSRLIRAEGFRLVRVRKGLWQVQDKSGDFPVIICHVYIWNMPSMSTDSAYSIPAANLQFNLMDRIKFEPRQQMKSDDWFLYPAWRRKP